VTIGGPAGAALSGSITGIGLVADTTAAGGWWNINEFQATSGTNAPLVVVNPIASAPTFGAVAAGGSGGGNSLTLNWSASANVHLQSTTSLVPPVVWTDVPDTTGQGSATVTTTNTQMFFRLSQQ
jgi:hypothetical protein